MDLTNRMHEYFTNGFQVFDGIEYHRQLEPLFETTEWEYEGGAENDYHPSTNKELFSAIMYNIHTQIADKFVEPNFLSYSIDKRRIWEGVNRDATQWHNDGAEGPTCFFLLYHSTMKDDGAIHFRNANQDWTFYPTPGMMIAVNSDNGFLHRADKSLQQRIISGYCFNVKHSHQYR